jgi:ankyrin repeat protein
MSMSKYELETLFSDGDAHGLKQKLEKLEDRFDNTALHFACQYGHHEMVSVLLVHSQINVNQKNNYGSTPFLLGCLNGRVKVVKILLKDSRVDINMADHDECTPL